ncbi:MULTISPECIES: N-acetylmuramidase [unclassified Sphingomonas]|uniref:glycoside hydrolase family 108 protein n=1 Tax=unclassified Sphingomonas TaxID=196159 RepID=UPI00226989EF|nr:MULTISPECIES: N-acetylmuramidase [unclassified Sphingomonas]
MKTIDQMIDDLVAREGGYVNHPADHGGPTCWGITQAKAREHGYTGDMRNLPKSKAREIYWQDFITVPGIDLLAKRSPRLAAEALDTGVNMGAPWGIMFLQTALNALNTGGNDWPDLPKIDGSYGARTDAALAACQKRRVGEQWEDVLLMAVNVQQGARYLDIIARSPTQEAFGWGWLRNRVLLAA